VNICSGNEYSLLDIITHIQKLTKNNSVKFCDEIDRKFSSNYICGSNAKLRNNSNWIPRIDISNGLAKIIEHNSKET
jgi:nucleoside-diphosphate-sugar epimerase